MKIVDIICSKSLTGFYFDDQKAIKAGATQDGFTYVGDPVTDKFTAIRQKGEAVSIMIILEDGQIGFGDATAVQYSGAGGRDPLFLSDDGINTINEYIKPLLIGKDVSCFKENAEQIDNLVINGNQLHTALRYGLTQALLHATAKANSITMPEVIRNEYNIKNKKYTRVPMFAQSGDDRYSNVDKMIIKAVEVMPHALINNIETKLGHQGEILKEYVSWLRGRVLHLRQSSDYLPVFHIDVYGTIGTIFNNDVEKMYNYLIELEELAQPFTLRIEGPVDAGNRKETMEALRDITKLINDNNRTVEIVADEWCNTLDDVKYFADNNAGHMLQVKTPDLGGVNNIIEALLYCKDRNIGAYSGGSCNETNVSAEVTTSIAMACDAKQCLAKPGMGTDEGIMIVNNMMNRTLAMIEYRNSKK
ncbi:Methylaspartate ammonia-lyase [Candidatus Izimaplasma bacterium HR1]|jgi:methylaspartate ammonia-lyase|uniref:methylaspartate ammonia-lyase n=1 Tax=Candidatus Izimoplasma sp. HR1 TaxID=1541959 RepID=UPI0004F8D081|nr:Methylaspartate ammonia-lyase [Candidatus Izimaplasma bacterium HR1]